MRIPLALLASLPFMIGLPTVSTSVLPVPVEQSSCLSIEPIGSLSLGAAPYSTGNGFDFFVRNLSSGSVTVTVSESSTGNLSNLSFFGGPNPFTLLILNETLDVGYTYDAGATGGPKATITVTATASCGSTQETWTVDIS